MSIHRSTLKIERRNTILCKTISNEGRAKESHTKRNGQLKHLGIICKGQFVDLVFQDDLIKCKQNFDVIMDDTFIHSTAEEHMDDLMDLFKVLRKYGLKLSPHKCQFFKKKIVYMGLEFQIQGDKVCYTPLKDKHDAIRNLESPKTLRQTRAFCGMVNFLSSFLPNLRRLLIPIYDLQES